MNQVTLLYWQYDPSLTNQVKHTEGAEIAPTTSFRAFKLTVALFFIVNILHSKGAQFILATIQIFVDKD